MISNVSSQEAVRNSSLPFGASAYHGGEDTVLLINILAVGSAFGAELSVAARVTWRTFHLKKNAVLYIGIDAAVNLGRTDIAEDVADLDAGFETRDSGL